MSDSLFEERREREKQALDRRKAMTERVAIAYLHLFDTEDGKVVLADLDSKFGLERLTFREDERGRYDYLSAAVTDGERRVMLEIKRGREAGRATLSTK